MTESDFGTWDDAPSVAVLTRENSVMDLLTRAEPLHDTSANASANALGPVMPASEIEVGHVCYESPESGLPKGSRNWLRAGRREIGFLKDLTADWDGQGTAAPNQVAVYWAEFVIRLLWNERLAPRRILPSAEEGIGFSFRSGNRYANIECFNTGEVYSLRTEGRNWRSARQLSTSKPVMSREIRSIRDFLAT